MWTKRGRDGAREAASSSSPSRLSKVRPNFARAVHAGVASESPYGEKDIAICLTRMPWCRSSLPTSSSSKNLSAIRRTAPRDSRAIRVIVGRALQAERRLTSGDTLRVASILTVAAICIAGCRAGRLRKRRLPQSVGGIWWAVTTTTTVGYGDLYPTTVKGRIIGIALMFVGLGFLSLLIASVASRTSSRSDGVNMTR